MGFHQPVGILTPCANLKILCMQGLTAADILGNVKAYIRVAFSLVFSSRSAVIRPITFTCAILLLSALRLKYLYKKVPANDSIAHKGRTVLSALNYKLNALCNVALYHDTPYGETHKINYKGIIPLYIVIVKSAKSIYRYFGF